MGTVSLALREDPRISRATTQRIQAAAKELGYDPARHDVARRLISLRYGTRASTRIVALILPPKFARSAYFTAIFEGVLEELTAQQYTLVTAYADAVDGTIVRLPPVFSHGDVDGLILTELPEELPPLLDHLRANTHFGDRPIVNLIHRVSACSTVISDDETGAYHAASHLLDLGHRHLLQFVGNPLRDLEARRLAGLRRALEARGLDPAAHLATYPLRLGWTRPETAVKSLAELAAAYPAATVDHDFIAYLRAHPEITALLASNDANALHAWYTLSRAGWRVPDDYSLIGHDDTEPMLDTYGENLLTTVRMPLVELGREGARLILRRIAADGDRDEHRVVPTELVVRRSTGIPRAAAP